MIEPHVVKALGHPVRLRILDFLRKNEMASANELAREFVLGLSTVSYHMRKLHSLGFLDLVAQTPSRGALERHYALSGSIDHRSAERAIGKQLLTYQGGSRAVARASLDPSAIADLREDVGRLFRRMQELEADTVTRGGVRGPTSTFAAEIMFTMEETHDSSVGRAHPTSTRSGARVGI